LIICSENQTQGSYQGFSGWQRWINYGDDFLLTGELVDLYRVALSNDLDENLNFCITKNIFVDVDVEKLNDVLSFSGHIQVDEDDINEINVEDCDRNGDKSIDKKEDNFD